MTPEVSVDLTQITQSVMPSYTYKIDFENKRIRGFTDGYEAIYQAVRKIIITERYSRAIYFGEYGIELEALIGKNISYVRADLERRINEAVKADERVIGIENLNIMQTEHDTLSVAFSVRTIAGMNEIKTEVPL